MTLTYEHIMSRYRHRQSEPFFNLTPQMLSEYVAIAAVNDREQARWVRSGYRGTLCLLGVPVRVRPLRAKP